MNNNNINNIDLEAGLDSPATISRTTPVKNGDDSNSISSATLVHPSNSYLAFRIRHFSPAWFSAVMGLGVSSAILYSFPFPHEGLRIAGMAVWGINVLFFTLCLTMFVLRFILYPEQLKRMLLHPGQSMFLGCLPMGFATIINVLHLMSQDYDMPGTWVACYVMWWIDTFLSIASCWGVCYLMFVYQKRPNLEAINPTIFLPIVPLVVASATGALIATSLPQSLKASTLIVSFMMWANGQLLAIACMAIYLARLFLKSTQPGAIILSTLLPVGPMGQGAFGILLLGDLYKQVFAPYSTKHYTGIIEVTPQSVDAISFVTMAVALFLIGVGLFWLTLAAFFTLTTPPPGYNMSWWATTFPIGTMAMAWYHLEAEFNNSGLKYIGALFGCVVLMNVCICFVGAIKHAIIKNTVFVQAKNETSPEE
ncbi:uncharacterized protein SAPINGB_P004549 [Magnusiomyces paraingens]|uniref:Sulfite efflux pump SSU1 n=1 Tax=Magnusiomyces paraingens TaxID=2606893 RepID=A0A5E8BV90_9ASCO|nr:uncharacterized protein SAPINGB_P004549 [Saprochaete ingens]VVT55343.1 unnamed protein product [Saprochaete ingens]